MSYATPAEVTAALAAHSDLALPGGDALVALIAAAERAVDCRLGPLAVDAVSGLKLTPELLNDAQRAALVRATAVAVAHLSLLDVEQAFGTDDVLPQRLVAVRGAGLDVRLDEQLAGVGLIARSGTAGPDPVLVPLLVPVDLLP